MFDKEKIQEEKEQQQLVEDEKGPAVVENENEDEVAEGSKSSNEEVKTDDEEDDDYGDENFQMVELDSVNDLERQMMEQSVDEEERRLEEEAKTMRKKKDEYLTIDHPAFKSSSNSRVKAFSVYGQKPGTGNMLNILTSKYGLTEVGNKEDWDFLYGKF